MIQWLAFTLLAVLIQGFFALFEMSAVSFNRIRLQYYVSRKKRRAAWLSYLIRRPSRLFGTTLIGINTALQFGSECARRFYESAHLDADFAPLTQVVIVLIFGELAPMFAARRHSEQIAMSLVPIVMAVSKVLTPITWAFEMISNFIHSLLAKPNEAPLFLSREEVKGAFEERQSGDEEFNALVNSIFHMRNLTAGQLMLPVAQAQIFSSEATVQEVRQMLMRRYTPVLPMYKKNKEEIIAVAHARSLLRLQDKDKIWPCARSPWFVTQNTPILQLLDQFRQNNQNVAVILNQSGKTIGILTLDQIVDSMFGKQELTSQDRVDTAPVIERTLSGSMTVAEFNRQFEADLEGDPSISLSVLIESELDHAPVRGESIRLGGYEFTVVELTPRHIRILTARTVAE